MKTLFALAIAIVISLSVATPTEAAVRVKGYFKPSTGTYVMPYYRSSPNRTPYDNYSIRGNYNPYSGKVGTKSPYRW